MIRTNGNPDCHVVLRGTSTGPNYDAASVGDALDRLEHHRLPRRLMIDASHANSGKDYERQFAVIANIADRIGNGEGGIVGVMLESFLVAGRQELHFGKAETLAYGQSITDACMGWETTVDALEALAAAITTRRTLVRS